MTLPKAKTDYDLELDNRLDFERTKLRLWQRVEYRQKYNDVLRQVKAEIEAGQLRTLALESGDDGAR